MQNLCWNGDWKIVPVVLTAILVIETSGADCFWWILIGEMTLAAVSKLFFAWRKSTMSCAVTRFDLCLIL